MDNTSGIIPCEYNVLVSPYEVLEKTKGGLFLPEDVKQKDENAQIRGTVVAMSPMAFSNPDWPEDRDGEKPAIGDVVLYARYSGASSKIKGADGCEYILIKDNNIMAIMKEPNE